MTIAPTQLGALYTRGAPIVLRRARALSGDERWAREVVQAVFMGVLGNPTLLGELRDPVRWLYRATTRACLERLRVQPRLVDSEHVALPTDGAPCLKVARRAASLPPPLDQVAVYAWLDGMGRAEIATVMGCSERHASLLLRQAAETLRSRAELPEATSAK